jgi:hypothetical protein
LRFAQTYQEIGKSAGHLNYGVYYQVKGEESMDNVNISVKGTILTAVVDLSKNLGASSSGKSIVIGSTQGNVAVPGHDDIKIGVNVYKKK